MGAVTVQCQALISFYVTVCVSPHAKCLRNGLWGGGCGGLTSCASAGNNFRGSTNKTSFSLMWKIALSPSVGLFQKVLQAQKASSFMWGWVVGGSLLVFSCWGEIRGWLARSTDLWAVLIRASNVSESGAQNHKASLRKTEKKHFWSVRCHESYLSDEIWGMIMLFCL